MSFQLPPLPFNTNSLESKGMSQRTLEFHHDKHHRAYVNGLNAIVEKDSSLQGKSLEELILLAAGNTQLTPLLNNAGQHFNHSLFWNCLSPDGGKIPSKLEKKIIEDFGSVDNFKAEFKKAATSQFGSGWAWLVLSPEGQLKITKTPNGNNPISEKQGKPLFTADVWEHAYYLDFQNRRPDFVTNFLDNLANYDFVEKQLD